MSGCAYCGRCAQPPGVVSCYGCGAALREYVPLDGALRVDLLFGWCCVRPYFEEGRR